MARPLSAMGSPARTSRAGTFGGKLVESLEKRTHLSASPAAAGHGNADRDLGVATYNVCIGDDVAGPIGAILSGDLNQIIPAVGQFYANVRASDFASRARAIADQIAQAGPALVGLQEVATFLTGSPDGPASPATDVRLDYESMLMSALAARGLHYQVVTRATNVDAEFPGITPEGIRDVRLIDHDLILARADLPTSQLKLSNAQTANFDVNLGFPTPFGPFSIRRSWSSVDAKVRGKTFRFITTHLEPDSDLVQLAQAKEILDGPADTNLPVGPRGRR